MSDAFVPEADALEQQRDVTDDEGAQDGTALHYPERMPPEASEADVLEQDQEVDGDEEFSR